MSRLFDLLGWLAVVNAKIAFQATWLQSVGWDNPLSETVTKQWCDYEAALPLLQHIRIPRWICSFNDPLGVELHAFSDASERAYAAVVYIRGSDGARSYKTALIATCSKVAPLKTVSLPRLKLCAAALLSQLASHIRETLKLREAPLHLRTDSTIALGWIRDHPTKWKTYVTNLSCILTTVPDALWHHVPGRDNPADCASRGISPSNLETHPLRWTGPSWLENDPASWPAPPSSIPELPEERVRTHAATLAAASVEEPAELLRFSSLHRLLRVTAKCRRWLSTKRSGPE